MIKLIDKKINKIKTSATYISIKFEDTQISKKQYTFLNDRMYRYKFYINNEYTLKSEIEYDESSKLLSIGINVKIPDHFIPKDPEKAKETIVDPIDVFKKFYEAQNEIFKKNH